MNPAAAADVTLQPVRRFDFDAAIIFSDILVVPHALGKSVEYDDGAGPCVEVTRSPAELCSDASVWMERLSPVYDAIRRVAAEIPENKDIIGFAGGPWTLATYMVQGAGSADQRATKLWAYRDKEGFRELLAIIAACVGFHLRAQIEAGATVVQLFDSWAGGLSEDLYRETVLAPSRHVVEYVRSKAPEAKIIGFPRGATQEGYREYLDATGVDGVSLDTAVPFGWAARTLGGAAALQGNLDPLVLVAGGQALRDSVARLLDDGRGTRHIVNLGHGVLPETPVENVAELVDLVRRSR